jgi:thiaminase/transcriptional activator TenA
VIGYAEIARNLSPGGVESLASHPYREWISEDAGNQDVANGARKQLNALAARSMTDVRFDELAAVFSTATRLEADFWQMGLDAGS